MQFPILEIIFFISQETDCCDELAIDGSLVDLAFSFFATHLQQYKALEENSGQAVSSDIDILNNETLLQIDLWSRIILNFSKNFEVQEYISKNKIILAKYMLLFIKNIDKSLEENKHVSKINSLIIANNLKENITACLYQLSFHEQFRQYILASSSDMDYIIGLLKTGSQNLNQVANACLLVSQLCQSIACPLAYQQFNFIEDLVIKYQIRLCFPDQVPENVWKQLVQERLQRQSYSLDLAVARTFYELTQIRSKCRILAQVSRQYPNIVYFQFLQLLVEEREWVACIYQCFAIANLLKFENLAVPAYIND